MATDVTQLTHETVSFTPHEIEQMKESEREIRERIVNFSVAENVPREELYDRRY